MIELQCLTVENFGPFQEQQSIDFGGQKGVYVVHGNNGHGKTSLLNACRWAFTGKTKNRRDQLINRAVVASSGQGPVVMRVSVAFTVDGIAYEVRRGLTREPGGQIKETLTLDEDGHVLGTSESKGRLQEILPAEIQQFFFFDGELMGQFESLLEEKSLAANELKDSIETVLGIPVLRDAGVTLSGLSSETTKALAKKGGADVKNKQIYQALKNLRKQEAALRATIKGSGESIKGSSSEISKLEKQMAESESTRALLTDRDKEIGKQGELVTGAETALNGLQENAATAWKALLNNRIADQIKDIKKRDAEISKSLEQKRHDGLVEKMKDEIAKTGICPICEEKHPKAKFGGNMSTNSDTEALSLELVGLQRQAATFQGLGTDSAQAQLHAAIQTDYDARNALEASKSKLRDIREKLKGVNEKDVGEIAKAYSNHATIRDTAVETKIKAEVSLDEVKTSIKTLEGKITDSGEGVSRLNKKVALLGELSNFFDTASDRYREDQKGRVEDAATKLFVSISQQDQYEKLRITENYGLEILHQDGKVEDMRSAGFEHIVAVSLIGALQETSPVKGPVVMDSPFGRLDREHGDRVIRMLPNLASQVLLLVQDRETTPEDIESALNAEDLVAQRRLRQVSAHETLIEPIKAGS
jgi:DNA sulfur modification protein DndD